MPLRCYEKFTALLNGFQSVDVCKVNSYDYLLFTSPPIYVSGGQGQLITIIPPITGKAKVLNYVCIGYKDKYYLYDGKWRTVLNCDKT